MNTKIIKLKRDNIGYEKGYEDFYVNRAGDIILCSYELGEFFTIPPECESLDVVLSKKETKESFELIEIHGQWESTIIVIKGIKYWDMDLSYRAEAILKEFGLPCYVSIEI